MSFPGGYIAEVYEAVRNCAIRTGGGGELRKKEKKKLNSPNIYARDFTTWGVGDMSLPQLILTKPGTKQRNRAQPRVHSLGVRVVINPSVCRGVPLVARVRVVINLVGRQSQ